MNLQEHGVPMALVIALSAAVPALVVGAPPPPKPTATRPAGTDSAEDDWASRRPRTDERKEERLRMVKEQLARRDVRDPVVLQAMREVPRHWFVPDQMQPHAYIDRLLAIGFDQTISQPYIVAYMTQALRLTPEAKVLEIGTGSGYQAAVLAEITPHVYTIEIVEPLAKRTIKLFERRGYDVIKTRIGDGYTGWPEQAPFDAIIATCAPGHVPPALVAQLKPGGRLCIPVGPRSRSQKLKLITKRADGSTFIRNLFPVVFVPMTGEAVEPRDGKQQRP